MQEDTISRIGSDFRSEVYREWKAIADEDSWSLHQAAVKLPVPPSPCSVRWRKQEGKEDNSSRGGCGLLAEVCQGRGSWHRCAWNTANRQQVCLRCRGESISFLLMSMDVGGP